VIRIGLVIGGSGGIGAACAAALAGSVDRVILVGSSVDRLTAPADRVGPTALPLAADITSEHGRAAIVDQAGAEGTELAWVVIASGRPLREPFADTPPASIEETLAADLVGPILLTRALSDVRWAPRAALVLIGSISASRGLPNRAVYSAAKAGLERFGASLAAEWQPRGIRVNIVAPGVIDTPFTGGDRANLERWSRERVPAGRPGIAEEVAELVRYVVLDAPDFVVGARLVIDGGSEAIA